MGEEREDEMNATVDIENSRVIRFDRTFPKLSNREYWLMLYLQLRDGGDDHSTACETVLGEIQMNR